MATPISSEFLRLLLLGSFVFLSLFCSLKAIEATESELQHAHTVQISSLLPASVCSPSTKGISGHNTRASLKVVHRHGPCSQLGGKSNPTIFTQILSHDQSRVKSIQSRLAFNSDSSKRSTFQDSQATLPAKSGSSLGSGNYVVTIGLGSPKKDLSLVFDTGSDLTWTQCQPCVKYCYKQQQPTFDPSESNTYSNITCTSTTCSQLSSATGNTPGCSASTCIYGIQYGDQSFSVGYFGKEKITLTPTDVFDNFLFGCGQNNRGLFGATAGLLGLGRDPLSIVSQTATKYGKYFSYCLPSMSSSSGHLTFGKSSGGVSSSIKFTPISVNPQGPSFYFIKIIKISVGGRTLSISSDVFLNAGTIIDSGTVITRLPPGAYTPLKTTFRQLMAKYPLTQPLSILDTCYDLSNYTTISIPKIGFGFSDNVQIDVSPRGILYAASASQVCLAFAGNSDASDTAIFGNAQQQTLEVVYDVAGGKLGFGPGGCA